MKKALLVALLLATFSVVALAQTVNVTFVVNSAAVSDTVTNFSVMRVAGDFTGWGTGTALSKIGGDYWSVTVPITQNTTLHYKYRLNGGWESDGGAGFTTSSTNRESVIGTKDTTLPLVFYYTGATAINQYWRPWGTVSDTMRVVYFRTNMMAQTKPFNPLTEQVGVRGDKKNGTWNVGTEFQWGTTHYLTREGTAGMAQFFWSGAVLLPKSKVPAGDTSEYKFIIGADWGKDESNNRSFTVPTASAETTLAWTWYNNESPITRVNPDTVTMTFIVNMTTATSKQSFKLGDTVQARAGYIGTADSERTVMLVKQGGTQNYAGSITMMSKIGAMLDYQYYLLKNGNGIRENYYNFQYAGITQGEPEKRQILVTSKTQTVTDNVVSVNDPRRQPYFENQTKLKQKVTVKWEVNLKPAYYALKAGKTLVSGQGGRTVAIIDSIKPWGVAMSGPISTLVSKDWPAWGPGMTADTVTQMWDDGTHGDAVANDTIYTKIIVYDTTFAKGKYHKFGVGGGDNESGYGLNHLENIDDTNPTYTLHVQFGSINPSFYSSWDFTNEKPSGTTSVVDAPVPSAYQLAQNFPNPFNPSTKIEFALPAQTHVTLRVYNVLGQAVATVVDGVMSAGTHAVTFDAAKMSSGVYFYRIDAGNFTSMKKMMLLK